MLGDDIMNDGGTASGICDTHMHVYGPPARFPAADLEPAAAFENYVMLRNALGISRTVYIQPSAYGRDHACLLDALTRDPAEARAIGIIGTEAGTSELERLDVAGMRGVRFHDFITGCLPMEELEPVAQHIAPLGWHVVVQVAGTSLPDYERRLIGLPCPFVIDHMGLMPTGDGVDHPAFRSLLRLLRSSRCWVKLSAPYEVAGDGSPIYVDAAKRVRAMVEVAPERLIWGSNWPHPRFRLGHKPDDAAMLASIRAWCGEEIWPAVAARNAERLYGFGNAAH